MCVHVALILLALVPSDPLMGYESNLARAWASVRYSHRTTVASPGVVGMLWRGDDPGLDDAATEDLVGEWAFDGAAKRLECRSPHPEMGSTPMFGRVPRIFFNVEPNEKLFDAFLLATADEGGGGGSRQVVRVQRTDAQNYRAMGPGPFQCAWMTVPLSSSIRREFEGVEPQTSRRFYHGRPVVAEVYDKVLEDGSTCRLDVFFDPEAGFLPVLVRSTSLTSSEASIGEMHLFRSEPCSAGGRVPTDYYETRYRVLDRALRHPLPNLDGPYEPDGPITLGHYRTLDFRDQSSPVELRRVESVRFIQPVPDEPIPFALDCRPMTMSLIRSVIGDEFEVQDDPRPRSATQASSAEADADPKRFALPPSAFGSDWPFLLVAAPAAALAAIALRRRGRGGQAESDDQRNGR